MQSILSSSVKNEFVAGFPGDHSNDRHPRQTPGMLYADVSPTPVRHPVLVAWSQPLAAELGIQKPVSPEEINILGGNAVSPYMHPYSACYGGHQFGNWAGQLGDGRAITLGEWVTPEGSIRELQLKGAGPTPYSRRADGRAVLRSSVREYLMSEAMHHLGVPTTRALSLVTTGDGVVRDMFYDGHPEREPGAIVMRVAPSFLRFGSFELPAVRKELDNLKALADWTISRFYPQFSAENDRIVLWYREVVRRTAFLISEWMRVGFVHGVMNTDNMSILGLTIDYGPFSFLDDYDPGFTPNTTDLPGRRYAFARQPAIAKWNLACLAGALSLLVPDSKPLADALSAFDEDYRVMYYGMMGRKLGLGHSGTEEIALITRFEQMLTTIGPDMTLFFLRLMELPADIADADIPEHFKDSYYKAPGEKAARTLISVIGAYRKHLGAGKPSPDALRLMREANPGFILRNYQLHQAIAELENGESSLFDRLHQAIRDPYSGESGDLIAKRPDWAADQPGCSMLSCSS